VVPDIDEYRKRLSRGPAIDYVAIRQAKEARFETSKGLYQGLDMPFVFAGVSVSLHEIAIAKEGITRHEQPTQRIAFDFNPAYWYPGIR
jgi:hypothetical protein